MKKLLAAAAGCAFALVSSLASAQGFQVYGSTGGGYGATGSPVPQPKKPLDNVGRTGQFVFSIERITGLFFDRQQLTYLPDGAAEKVEHTFKATSFGLFGVDSASPSALPRFALDYVVYKGITAGATALFSTRGVSLEGDEGQAPGAPPTAADDGLTLLGGLRAGFAYPFDRTFGIWPRAGLSYSSSSASGDVIDPRLGDRIGTFETKVHFWNANLEILGVLSPVEHIVITGGPYLDLALGGGYSLYTDGVLDDRRDAHLTSFGFVVHAGGYY